MNTRKNGRPGISGFAVIISFYFFQAVGGFPAQAQSSRNQPYDVAAYVWPAYQPEQRFKDLGVFRDGKGEWEAIYHAKPKFKGHDQPHVPLWGYTNEADPGVMEKKINSAVSHGVNVFIYDWYWYDGKPFLEKGIDSGFLKARNRKTMKFYLMWANHDHTSYLDYTDPDKSKVYWKGGVDRPTFDKMVGHIIKDYFLQPNYYKINGEPVFSIYELSSFINGIGGIEEAKEALRSFTERTKQAGFPGLHLQGILWGAIPATLTSVPGDSSRSQDNTVKELGFKSLTNYQWCHYVPLAPYDQWGTRAIAAWQDFRKDFSILFIPHISINWDPNPRFPDRRVELVTNANPEDFKKFLQQAKAYLDQHPELPKLVTINAWNEWAEGSYLEPDKERGFAYLDAVKAVFLK